MKFSPKSRFLTGVCVPLSALKTDLSVGIGEFPDLVLLGKWCQQTGLGLIQILPINDTGYESSPYNALSAFALHPIYLSIQGLPGSEQVKKELSALSQVLNRDSRVDHRAVLEGKLVLLRRLFETVADHPQWLQKFSAWMKKNPWAKSYAVFCALKHRFQQAGWRAWPQYQQPSKDDMDQLWEELKNEAAFFVWLQICSQEQLSSSVMQLHAMGIALKGDLPILLNEDSADVWACREYFDLSWRAGAPPDGLYPGGQNWGFPLYRWEVMAKDNYSWWRDRLKQAAQFYHAYRIDHVLGFFRLWATSEEDVSARLGVFSPNCPLKYEELSGLNFDEGRIVWLSEPHIFGTEIRETLKDECSRVVDLALFQLGNEDLYRFKPAIHGEKAILRLPVSDHAQDWLLRWYRNRALIRLNDRDFVPLADYATTQAYNSLSDEERWNFERLIHGHREKVQKLWEDQGRRLLSVMKETTDMLVCAEDLGSIPPCVPQVLAELRIFSLKIIRWARDWQRWGQPYVPVAHYPELSVCTASVHDTSTLRQWWNEEKDHKDFLSAIGLTAQDDEDSFTPILAEKVIRGILRSSSKLCILALQDWFLLNESFLTADPHEERINIPGTVNSHNWSYRMGPSVEELLQAESYNKKLAALIVERSLR